MRRPANQLEREIQAPVVAYALAQHGIEALKLRARGWPDYLFPIPGGRPLIIEFKKPGGRLSAMQKLRVYKLMRDGYDVEIHDDAERAIASLDAYVLGSLKQREERLRLPGGASMAQVEAAIQKVDFTS